MPRSTKDTLKRVRGLLKRFTTPLLPDDYSVLLNPLWSTRELRGTIKSVEHQGEVVHLVITPGWGVPVDFHAGQYIGIGVEIDGRYTWRSYSLTHAPGALGEDFAITVRAVEKGKLSNHLVGTVTAGTVVRLAAPAGDFHLSNPLPPKILFLAAGTGITPIMSMLRTLDERGQFSQTDVAVVYSAHDQRSLIFARELTGLVHKHDSLKVHIQITEEKGRVTPENIADIVPDVTRRVVYACGPALMLDDFEAWASTYDVDLRTERFSINRASDAQGGVIDFGQGRTIEVDGATTILEAGEKAGVQLPFGCRMGICHTCTRTLREGTALNLASGEEHEQGERIRTCVSVAAGDICIS